MLAASDRAGISAYRAAGDGNSKILRTLVVVRCQIHSIFRWAGQGGCYMTIHPDMTYRPIEQDM